MHLNVEREVALLGRMTVGQLRDRYAEVFGQPTNASNNAWLRKRVAWRLQALAEGGLSERARRRAAELANDADLRLGPPRAPAAAAPGCLTATKTLPFKPDDRLPPPGTVLSRPYKA